MNDMRYFLFSMTVAMLCLSCGQKQKGNLEKVCRIGAIFSTENALNTEDTDIDYDQLTDEERNRITKMHQYQKDSIIVNVKFPKPEVKLVYNDSKELAVAKRVQDIYDDVLETRNYMFHGDKDFFRLYWSKALYADYEKACENDDCVLGADPYTGSQEHLYAHLQKVTVTGMYNNRASAHVIFGVYGIDEIYICDNITLSLVCERGNWYIDDIQDGDDIPLRSEIKESIKQYSSSQKAKTHNL